jgi:hypothetical protein
MSELLESGLPFDLFVSACRDCGLSVAPSDISLAHATWRVLDWTQQQAAIDGIRARLAAGEYDDSAYRPLPQNYLSKRMWQRPIRVKRELRQTSEVMRSIPQEKYEISQGTVDLLDWAEQNGYPLNTGGDVVRAEEAYRKAKGSAECRGGMK